MWQKMLAKVVGASTFVALLIMPGVWAFNHTQIFLFRECDVKQIGTIPQNSILIAGHVYREVLATDKIFDPRLEDVIKKNHEKLEMVILTGDIFNMPKDGDWRRLKSFFSQFDLDVFITPGNHDVMMGASDYREIFKAEFPNPYVQVLKNKSNIILEDSTQSDGIFAGELFRLADRQRLKLGHTKKLFIFRHHIAVKGMLSNSRHGQTSLPDNIYKIEKAFDGPVTIISGDGGTSQMPRLQCTKYKNLTFMVSGLGASDNDNVLILYEDKIWTYPIGHYEH